MHRVAIVINTRYGQTEKIALSLRQKMLPFCAQVHVFRIDNPADSMRIDLNHYDLVIIGAPVYVQKFSSELQQWVRTFSAALHSKTCALYTVSGNAADPRPGARAADDMLLRKFMNETGLLPAFVASFGGAIHFTKYNFLVRWMMKSISKKAGGSTDTSRDHELTDWNEVDGFVHAILENEVRSKFGYEGRFGAAKRSHYTVVTSAPVGSR
jgi:menaquinone-dependent protoporphyrinogen oxidase